MGRPMSDVLKSKVHAEASVWVARLHSDARTPATDAAFSEWLRLTEGGREAFDELTSVWESLPGAARILQAKDVCHATPARPKKAWKVPVALAAGIAGLAVLVGIWAADRPQIYDTGRGQTRTVTLADGSVLKLNTGTKLEVRLRPWARDLHLVAGEARFDVAPDVRRPFTVTTDEGQVTALGTAFVVRDLSEATSVTLLHGRVEVGTPLKPFQSAQGAVILAPGQRAIVSGRERVIVDQPDIAELTAWEQGRVVFSGATLMAAVQEMNRYAVKPIKLKGVSVATIRVSGVFGTDDAADFAVAVGRLNDLKVRDTGEAIEISK